MIRTYYNAKIHKSVYMERRKSCPISQKGEKGKNAMLITSHLQSRDRWSIMILRLNMILILY